MRARSGGISRIASDDWTRRFDVLTWTLLDGRERKCGARAGLPRANVTASEPRSSRVLLNCEDAGRSAVFLGKHRYAAIGR